MKVALLADLHYSSAVADYDGRRTSGALDRLDRFLTEVSECDFILNLGDIVNGSGNRDLDRSDLRRVLKALDAQPLTVYHTIGNHDLWAMPRGELVAALGLPAADYSFKRGDVRFVVLDANYSPDGGAPRDWTVAHVSESRLVWLDRVLSRDDFKWAIVVCHHCLDDLGTPEHPDYYAPDNAAEVRAIIEKCGKVPLVLSGHCHEGRLRPVGGVMYYTQPAICEGDALTFGILELDPDTRKCGVEPHGMKVEPRLD